MTCRFENQKLNFPKRTKRTKRTKSLFFKACVLYVVRIHCTLFVRCHTRTYTVEPLILLGFVRFVRSVRYFLYTRLYRTYIFWKIQSSARARVRMFPNNVQNVQNVHCP